MQSYENMSSINFNNKLQHNYAEIINIILFKVLSILPFGFNKSSLKIYLFIFTISKLLRLRLITKTVYS